MDRKRWLALGAAVLLFVVSIGFRFATSVASGFITDMAPFVEKDYVKEQVIEDGRMTSKIAVLKLDGVIQDVGVSPLIGAAGYNHQNFLDMIDKAGTDPFVDAVVLSVDSPGGGVVESAQIHERLAKFEDEYNKPLYVSMGGMAASGGYYISAPADKIFAEPATLTGSIGVIMQNINYAKLAEDYGVKFNTITSGKHKDILSSSREMTEEERDILQSMIDEMYGDFVDVIVEGRNMDEKRVRELADGRIYTGRQAKEVGLIDEIGSFEDTVQALKTDHNLDNAQVVQYGYEMGFLAMFNMSAQSLFRENHSDVIDLVTILGHSDSPRAMYLYSK